MIKKVYLLCIACAFIALLWTGCAQATDGKDTPQEVTFTVTFQCNGGSPVEPVQVESGRRFSEPVSPVRQGFGFAGWYKDNNFTTPWDFEHDRVNQNITLYARWEPIEQPQEMVYTSLPASADGTWSYQGSTIFVISGSVISYNGVSNLLAFFDQDGELFYQVSGNYVPLTNYTWDGSVIRFSGVALDHTPPGGTTEPINYTLIPASADGTWSLNGTIIFTVTDSCIDYAGFTILPLVYDDEGNLYYQYTASYYPLTGYTWDGSVIRDSGVALDHTPPGGTTEPVNYTALPASADGTWSYEGTIILTVSNSIISYNGLSNLPAVYDDEGNLYYEYMENYVPLTYYTWDGSVIRISGVALDHTPPGGTTEPVNYTALPASADGTWSLYGTPAFTITDSCIDYAGLSTLPLVYDDDGNLYYTYGGSYYPLSGYTWDGSVIRISGVALDHTPPGGTTEPVNYTQLPASADGTWSLYGVAVFTVTDSCIDYAGLSSLPLVYDDDGNLYYSYGGSYYPLSGYTWDGTVISAMGLALDHTPPGGTTEPVTYTALPASADGTWSLYGTPAFTITDSCIDYAGLSTLPLVFDDDGNLYYSYGGSYYPLSGYTWDGSVIRISGIALDHTPPGGSTGPATYTQLPASADGTWSFYGTVIFSINNSIMSYQTMTNIPVFYDSNGNLIMQYMGVYSPLSGYTWDGTAIYFQGFQLTKS